MNPFVAFMASTAGRIIRAVAGAVLVYLGLISLGGLTGIIVAMIGLAVFSAGTFDFCMFAPLFGNPLSGKKIRVGK